MFTLLFKLVAAHYIGDFALQNDFIAKFKVQGSAPFWFHVLIAHCMIHGLGVYLATGRVELGLAEVLAHGIIDSLKGRGQLSFNTDQAIHLICKVIWAVIAMFIS